VHLRKIPLVLLAICTLSLGCFSSVTAQDNHQAPVQVTFNKTDCAIVIDGPPAGQSAFDFGTWTWNGTDDYTLTAGTGSVSIGYTAVAYTDATQTVPCSYTVDVRGHNFTGVNKHQNLDGSNFKWGQYRLYNSPGYSVPVSAAKSSEVFMISTSFIYIYADVYTGTLDFTVEVGA